jgi:hypothetical protein
LTEQQKAIKRPWRDRRPRQPQHPDVAIRSGAALAQITIYPDMTLLTRRQGLIWRQYPVSPDGLAQTLARIPSVTGLLPPHTLGGGRVAGVPFLVVYVPARRATLRMETKDFDIPLPPLVWAGCGGDYRIWALATPDLITDTRTPLMRAPFPNSYNKDGGICWGSTDPRPAAAATTMQPVLDLFLQDSYFNAHLQDHKSVGYPGSVVARWQQLVDDRAEAYPLDDLMPAECQLGWALEGRPWAH